MINNDFYPKGIFSQQAINLLARLILVVYYQ